MGFNNTLEKKEIAKKVWLKLFHPLPIGSLVKVKNRAFTFDYYVGEIIVVRMNGKENKNKWHYIIRNIRCPTNDTPFWVRPEKIAHVIRYGKEKEV